MILLLCALPLGTHSPFSVCVSFRKSEGYNETWEISSKENVGLAQYHHYSRPVYRYVGGNPEADEHFRRIASDSFNITDTSETDFVSELMYTGDRWFCFSYPQNNYTLEELRNGALDYHGELNV